MTYKLSDVCNLITEKWDISHINKYNYISTENMLPNKKGVCLTENLPKGNKTLKFSKDDILISNIRPYFKKIWFAKNNGGCSNDILILRANKNYIPQFLYYVLSQDRFFNYVTNTSKGTKMPRGDKNAIMSFKVPNLNHFNQRIIINSLSKLDDKIEINNNLKLFKEKIKNKFKKISQNFKNSFSIKITISIIN